jgi:hypothetical protein
MAEYYEASQTLIDEARKAVRDAMATVDRATLAAAQQRLTIAECDWSFIHAGRLAGIDMGARHG